MTLRTLSNFESFHRLVPALVKRMAEDVELAARAMANPILALRELGIELTPELAREVERFIRFSEEDRKKLSATESKLHKELGELFDPESTEDIERVLFVRLKLHRPAALTSIDTPPLTLLERPPPILVTRAAAKAKGRGAGRAATVNVRPVLSAAVQDPLLQLKGKHKVVDLLLEFRAVSLRVPKFSPPAAYAALKSNPTAVPVSRVVVHLPEHLGGQDA